MWTTLLGGLTRFLGSSANLVFFPLWETFRVGPDYALTLVFASSYDFSAMHTLFLLQLISTTVFS